MWNQGRLPAELTPEKLLERHSSYPRNKNLAEVFYRAGFIESWGSGIRKIVDGMTNAGLPRPKIEDADGGVRVTIYRNAGVPQDVPQGVPQDVPQDVAQDVAQGAVDLQQQILEIIRKNPNVSRADIAVQCGKSVKTIERRLGEMTHLVKYVGSGYSGHWEIVTPADRK